MSFLSNNYMQKPPSQSIPVELKYNGPDAQDIVVNKTTVSLVPVSGDIIYGTSEVSGAPYSKVLKFRIRSNNWIDLRSLRMNAKATIESVGFNVLSGIMAMPDDSMYTWINSARVFLNSQLVEDISEYHRLIPLLAYSSMKREYYNGPGSFEGWHRFSDKQFYPLQSVNGSAITTVDNTKTEIDKAFEAITNRYSPMEQNARFGLAQMLHDGMDISLHPFSGVTSMEKFLPPNVTLELEFQFNEPKDCLTNRAEGGPVGERAIKWEGVRMVYDQVELHPAYTARFEQELKKGIPMVFDTYSLNRSYLPKTNAQHNVLISRGVSRLRTLLMVQNDTAVSSAGDDKKYKSSQFNWNNLVNVRAIANGEYFPSSYGCEGRVPEIFRQLQIAFDKNEDADASGVLNLLNYTGRTEGFPAGANAPSAPQQAFIVGLNFQKMPGVRTSGLDLSSLGGNIQVELTQSDVADEDQTLYSYLHYDKGIMLTDQGLAVSE